jgi:hypothetical protein
MGGAAVSNGGSRSGSAGTSQHEGDDDNWQSAKTNKRSGHRGESAGQAPELHLPCHVVP